MICLAMANVGYQVSLIKDDEVIQGNICAHKNISSLPGGPLAIWIFINQEEQVLLDVNGEPFCSEQIA